MSRATASILKINECILHLELVTQIDSVFKKLYCTLEAHEDFYLGSEIKTAKQNDPYRLFVPAGQDYTRLRDFRNIGKELDDSTFISGRTYFIKNGTDINGDVWDWELAKDKKF